MRSDVIRRAALERVVHAEGHREAAAESEFVSGNSALAEIEQVAAGIELESRGAEHQVQMAGPRVELVELRSSAAPAPASALLKLERLGGHFEPARIDERAAQHVGDQRQPRMRGELRPEGVVELVRHFVQPA